MSTSPAAAPNGRWGFRSLPWLSTAGIESTICRNGDGTLWNGAHDRPTPFG